jgi:hypothetical protein
LIHEQQFRSLDALLATDSSTNAATSDAGSADTAQKESES